MIVLRKGRPLAPSRAVRVNYASESDNRTRLDRQRAGAAPPREVLANYEQEGEFEMKKWILSALALALVVGLTPAMAQEEEEASQPFVYASYYKCDTTRLGELEELMKKIGPMWDQEVADGNIMGWGWLRHHTGGSWMRGFYAAHSDASELMDAMEGMYQKVREMEGSEIFGEICHTHEDYVWRQVAASPEGAVDVPGNVGLSIYYECTFNAESWADNIFEAFMAPVFNAHTGEGKLASWGWLQHQMGGKYRRLLTMRAADRDSLMEAWGDILGELSEKQDNALTAFSEACFSHADYLWLMGQGE
jgi:hypothetical protein